MRINNVFACELHVVTHELQIPDPPDSIQETQSELEKSGPKVAQNAPKNRLSKTHPDYWKPRLVKRAGSKDCSVRIQHAGRREWFNTRSANAATAADRARKIYLDVVALGWPGAVEKHKPKPTISAKIATVGEIIAAAGRIAAIRATSLNAYASAIRRLAGEIAAIPPPTVVREIRKRVGPPRPGKPRRDDRFEIIKKTVDARSAYKTPEFTKWREKVDALPVDTLSAGAVAEWKACIVAAKNTPVEQKSAAISCDTIARCAAALFGKKLRPILARELTLPDPLPLSGLSYGRSSRRFRPTVNPSWLFEQARQELAGEHPEQFKALTLCLLAGLRRAEVDTLTWEQIDLEAGRLSIRATEYFHPKSEESTREIDLPPAAVDILRTFKTNADPVFVLHGAPAKPRAKYKWYRADHAPRRGLPAPRTWERLLDWLADKGVKDLKAVHALRKYAGSLIHATHGLEVAREFLGHRDIATTSASYVDKRPRVTVNIEPNDNDLRVLPGQASA